MSKIYVFNSIITNDLKDKKSYILSASKDKIVFPYFEIQSPRYLFNEIRCNIKNLFKPDSIRFIEEIIISFTEIQNELIINYVENLQDSTFDLNNDIFILSSTILSEKLTTPLVWTHFNYTIDIENPNVVDSIIDYSLQKSLA
jgi:hypothetical protein